MTTSRTGLSAVALTLVVVAILAVNTLASAATAPAATGVSLGVSPNTARILFGSQAA